jgi:hypothetical protein
VFDGNASADCKDVFAAYFECLASQPDVCSVSVGCRSQQAALSDTCLPDE